MEIKDFSNISKTYDIVYTDPPWPQTKGNLRNCRPNQGRTLDYPTMSLQDIAQIHETISKHCSKKHNIFMWTIDKYLIETENFMKKLGYKVHARFIWDKGNGIAPAFTVRFSHEYLLWFYSPGCMYMPSKETRGKYTTIIQEPATTHSHKPEIVYSMIDEMFPNAEKIELFARNKKKNWDCWGNQTDKFEEVS